MITKLRMQSFVSSLTLLLVAAVCVVHAERDITLDQITSSGDEVAAKAAASVISGASHPLSLSGDALIKLQGHLFTQCPDWLKTDRSWIEPSESKFALKMKIRPNRHAIIFSGFGFTIGRMSGTSLPNPLSPGSDAMLNYDSIPFVKNLVMDNTIAGVALLAGDATLWLRMGGVIWVQSSPLSVWGGESHIRSSETKRYAWDYLPWEDDKPVGQYYFDRTIKGETIGEAADRWNKQPFKGINLETEGLPRNFYGNLIFAQRDAPDKDYGRNPVDFGSHYVFLGRLSQARKLRGAGQLTLGFNTVTMFYGRNVTKYRQYEEWNEKFLSYWELDTITNQLRGNAYYRNHQTSSLDLRGLLTPKTDIHFEVGAGFQDSVHLFFDSSSNKTQTSKLEFSSSAFFGSVRDDHLLPLRLQVAWIPPKYYSYQGYDRNMLGGNLSYLPNVPWAKLRFSYGQQREIVPTQDILRLAYRLNGPDFQTMLYGTYSRFAGQRMDKVYGTSQPPRSIYQPRAGDEISRARSSNAPFDDILSGGIRGDFQSTFETFAAFASEAQVDSMYNDNDAFQLNDIAKKQYLSPYVPRNNKWKSLVDLDFSFDIQKLMGLSRSVLLVGQIMLDGTAKEFQPLSLSQKNILLWSMYARVEPALAVTPSLYVAVLYGFEWWKSDMSYMVIGKDRDARFLRVPIDYRDQALGVGFDWDASPRVGIHARYKIAHHNDVNWKPNTYVNHFGYGLVKIWF